MPAVLASGAPFSNGYNELLHFPAWRDNSYRDRRYGLRVCHANSAFSRYSNSGNWWTATANRNMGSCITGVYHDNAGPSYGFSVRRLKNPCHADIIQSGVIP